MDPLAIVKGIKTYLNDDYYICGIYIYNIEAGVLMDSNKLCGPQTLSLSLLCCRCGRRRRAATTTTTTHKI